MERYTKKQKVIPVGDTVAVQNQTGRFPKKWDKTGKVVENQEHDKVLVKLDGSGRLTTRNRRFVKKIVSPPDLAQTDVPQAQSPVPEREEDVIPEGGSGGNIIPGLIVGSGTVENNMSNDQIGHDNQNDEVDGNIGNEVIDVIDDIVTNEDPVLNGRPKRDRKQNVRYSSKEYDLSAVSVPGNSKLTLSSIFVQPNAGKLMKERTNRRI